MNELLLIGSLIFIYGGVLIAYRLFGRAGLYMMTVLSTVLANIECLILIRAFGMEQTLGNVFFAATFLITDILSENESKKSASRAVWIGVFTSVFTILATSYWFLYTPSEADFVMPYIKGVFSNTPRMMLASLSVYAISQRFDVWLYHAWWKLTTKKTGNSRGFLWLRNNGSTLVSQIVNTLLFTIFAFFGTYDLKTLGSIMLSSYVIFIFTSLLDTPVVYIARRMKQKGWVRNEPGDKNLQKN
ncbi:MAG: queuosine precursor transporter [Eubacteriales bacterium]